jgi:hypothetical protein
VSIFRKKIWNIEAVSSPFETALFVKCREFGIRFFIEYPDGYRVTVDLAVPCQNGDIAKQSGVKWMSPTLLIF